MDAEIGSYQEADEPREDGPLVERPAREANWMRRE
jgi:hypothetical protein